MRRGFIAAVVGGLFAAASVPPFGWWPLAPVGLAIVVGQLVDRAAKARAVVGLGFGLGLFVPSILWIGEFHWVGFVLLVLLETSFFAGGFAICPPGRTRCLVAFPAAMFVAEAARSAVPLGGFPMGGLPLGQAEGPLAPAARIGGALLVTALIAVLGVGLACFRRRLYPAFLACVVATTAVAALGRIAPDGAGRAPRHTIRVAAVQGGGPRGFRAVETDPGDVFVRHIDESAKLRPPLDLVVWPENAIDVSTFLGSPEEETLGGIASRLPAVLVAGVTEDIGTHGHFENSAVAFDKQGTVVDSYTKVKRVPFGEYVPGRFFLRHLVDLSVLPRDAVPGRGPGVLRTPVGTLGVAISFEVLFSERGRTAAAHGAEVLLVPTNAASFKTSQVPTEEVAASRLRAWETGRWVVQAAPTGYSAIVDPRGRVIKRSVLSRAQLLTGTIELRTGRTLYVRWGDGPLLVVAMLILLLATRPVRRGSAVEAVGPGDVAEPVG